MGMVTDNKRVGLSGDCNSQQTCGAEWGVVTDNTHGGLGGGGNRQHTCGAGVVVVVTDNTRVWLGWWWWWW